MVVITGSPRRISRASRPERSRFIGASDGPLGSATCDSSPKNSRPRTGGNIANVPARPGRHVVGLDPVFPQAPRDRRRARRELAGRGDCHAGTGLGTQSPGFARDLWHAAHQSYSLERVIRVVKFGPPGGRQDPSYNIRITTFFAGESEAKIVNRSRFSEVQAVGGEVDFARPLE